MMRFFLEKDLGQHKLPAVVGFLFVTNRWNIIISLYTDMHMAFKTKCKSGNALNHAWEMKQSSVKTDTMDNGCKAKNRGET